MRGAGPVLRDVWRLTWPYFRGADRAAAGALLAAMVVLQLAGVGATVLMSFWRNSFFNTLQNKDWGGFVDVLLLWRRTADGLAPGFAAIIAVKVAASILFAYAMRWLEIRWRAWLTRRFQDAWLDRRAYYRMGLDGDAAAGADNPDQRISEDVNAFVVNACELSVGLLKAMATVASFVGILWALSGPASLLGVPIPGWLVWVALLYAGAGTWLANAVGRKLVGLRFRQQRVEADFRYALMRVRENAEAIAFQRGEPREKALLGARFARIAENWRRLMNRNLRLDAATNVYADAAGIFPVVVTAPRYFAGATTLGDMMQSVGAFSELQDSLSWFVNAYPQLAEWRAVVARLTTFEAAAGAPEPPGFLRDGRGFGLADATLSLPGGAALLSGADLELRAGESVVVTGPAGSGKSTLLRALAGLWPFGSGGARAPDDALFLPQRPYIPLGTLRDAATYPAAPGAYPDADVAAALGAAGLGALAARLDEDADWSRRLSGGEQQRLAAVRALLARPAWLFLDEATSALDPDGEAELYRALRERLPGTTIVSVAHRPSAAAVHDRRVAFEPVPGGPGRLSESRPLAAD